MIEAQYVPLVSIQPAPDLNLFTNPTAEFTTATATGTGLASFVRQSGDTVNLNTRTGTAFRLNGNAGASDSYMNVGGDAGGGIRNGLQPGVQYTVSGGFYISAALSGTAHTRARRVVVFHRIGAAAYTEVASAQAANVAGNTRLSATFTLPAGTTEAFVRFYHGHAGTGAAFWHSLRLAEGTQTDYFDGGLPRTDVSLTGTEYGWDYEPGESTSYRVNRTNNVTLPGAEFDALTFDAQRVPWIDARITAPLPSPAILAMLDPRRPRDVILNYRIDHYTRGAGGLFDSRVSASPYNPATDAAGKLWLRDIRIDEINREITLTAKSGEARFEDTKRIAATPRDTNASTGRDLFEFALREIGEASAIASFDIGANTLVIPAGDRRLWMQGESTSTIFEAELAAIGLRGYCDDIGNFHVRGFDDPPDNIGTAQPVADGDGGNLYEYETTITRDGEWSDATIVKAQYVDGSGVQQTAWQAYPSGGLNRKGSMVTLNRAIPSATYAQTVTERAAARSGETVRMTVHLDFRHRVARPITLTIGGASAGTIIPTRIAYRPTAGVMDIEGTRE